MENKILFSEGNYTIKQHSGISSKAIDFFEQTAWGGEGAVYENRNTKDHIHLLQKPMLLAIHENDLIQGTAVFCNKSVTVAAHRFNCNYVKYVALSKAIRGKGLAKRYSIKIMSLIRNNEAAKTIYFAYVERANKSSYKVVQTAGYKSIGTIKTMGFSRFFPKSQRNIEKVVSNEDKKKVLLLLQNQYQTHALVHFDSIFMNDNYYVIRKNNEIVAGCQYHRGHWVINRMKGLTGKLILKVVPLIPILNKVFNPKRFEFLTFEGIYLKAGYEAELHMIFEHLLAKEKLKSAMYWLGETCPIRAKIEKIGKHGLIHSFIKDNDVEVMAAFENMNDDEIKAVQDLPLFISGFDCT